MRLFTIGFTKRSAASFFGDLRASGAQRLIDVRLNNVSQLAGFAKRDDLRYFLREICAMDYLHEVSMAPTASMLDDYRKGRSTWAEYSMRYSELLSDRRVENEFTGDFLDRSVFLCSEATPERCHRRLLVEYLVARIGPAEVRHL